MDKIGWIIIIIAAVLITVPIIISYILMKSFIRRYDMDKYSFSLRISDICDRYNIREVSFKSCGEILHGYIFNENSEGKLVVMCHGLFGGAEEYLQFAMHFADKGFCVFMFDNTGCNKSGGSSIKGSLQGLFDLNSAMKYIMTQPELAQKKKVLVGHSWGGFTVAAFRPKDYGVEKVVSLAGFDRPAPAVTDCLTGLYGDSMKALNLYSYITLFLMYGYRFNTSSVKNINKTNLPYLIIQGNNDKIIHHNGSSIYNNSKKITNKNVSLILIEDENHNKHNTIFRDADATEYMKSRYAEFKKAKEKYSGKELEEVQDRLWAETDRFRINTLDKHFTELIDEFILSE